MSEPILHQQLARKIGLGTAIAVTVGSTIGSGIFRTPAGIAEALPGPLPMLICWAVAGLLALCGALTLAEVGSAHPETGGLYAFIRDAFGRLPAFLFGWAQLFLIRPAGVGAVAMAFAEYALRAFDIQVPEESMIPHYVGAAAIVVVSFFNYIGVKVGGGIQSLTTILKVLGLMTVVVIALVTVLPTSGGNFSPAWPEGSFSLTPFALALISVLWAYDGWADASYVAGEVVDPKRNVPRALVWGTIGIIAVYLLANLAYLSVYPVGTIAKSPLIAADVAQHLMGPAGVVFISVTVMISTFGTLNGSMMTAPRIFFAMADDRLFFRPVAHVSERFGTPGVATWLACILGVGFVLNAKFEHLADIFVTAMIPFYAIAVGTIFWMRKQNDYEPSVRTPLFPATPILFIAAMLFIFGNALWEESSRLATLGVCGGILLGVPVYFLTVGRRLSEPDPGPSA
ncbi:MAG TPA: amino acid permease [Fimbriimonadaceae bacterium]|nr:amino acid permease [Fimbriimonadaceae bacterium]